MPIMQSAPGAETTIDGRRYLYFGGTGYLGLQGHPEVIRAACEAAELYGLGSATSRSGFGNTPPVLDVERQAAALFGRDDAFYVVSGYVANHVLVLALEGKCEAVFVDALAHYSVHEAARLSGLPVHRFGHRDPEDLRLRLRDHLAAGQRPLVMTDGVFAALGRTAPLASYAEILAQYPGAILLVDDAHGIGVLGRHGRGTLEHLGLFDGANPAVPDQTGCFIFVCGTLSKAVGGFGGIVPGPSALIERLKATSPYYPGASALPPPVAAATARGLALVRSQPELRAKLSANVERVKSGLRALGLQTDSSSVPIVALSLGTAENMERIHGALRERGILVPYMPRYAGLGPEGVLRLAVFATHTEPMIERLLEGFRQAL